MDKIVDYIELDDGTVLEITEEVEKLFHPELYPKEETNDEQS